LFIAVNLVTLIGLKVRRERDPSESA